MAKTQPGIKDSLVFTKYGVLIWYYIIKMVLRHGAYDMVRDIIRYPWILDLLKVNGLLQRLTKDRSGEYRKAVSLTILTIARQMIEMLERAFHESDKLILHQDIVPPEIFYAMGLKPWTIEALGALIPMLEPRGMERYIDACENEGFPADTCSFVKSAVGMILEEHLPPTAIPIVASNMPCDCGMSSYYLIAKRRKVPVYFLDVPYQIHTDRAVNHFVDELKEMIAWLEKNSPGKMDWDSLKDRLEKRNRMVELEMEIWEMIRQKPAPMAAEPIYLSHLWTYNISPGSSTSVELFERLTKMTRKNLEMGIPAVKNEKYRALLWSPPTAHFFDLFAWAEKAYGVTCLMDMMSYNRQPLIDTSSPEMMLKGLAWNIMDGPMVRHSRGPAENYLDDIFHIYRMFDLDMIWVAGHIGCKNTWALSGMLREICREKGIPLLIIEYDLCDPRITTREGIIRQVETFMDNVMKAPRLDPSIVKGIPV